jgi:hypothetical protein
MPQIPRYNRGLGPTVEVQAGQLAPRLQDFSQAVAAPYKVASEVLGAVSETAAAYEQKRQQTAFNRYEQQYYNLIDNEGMQFVTTDVSRSPEEYKTNANARFDKIITGIDKLENIPSSLKSKLKTNVQFRLNNRLLEGANNAFIRQLEDDSELYNNRLNTLVKDYAYAEGQSVDVGGGAPPIVKQTVIMDEMLELVRQAKEEGLPVDLDEQDLFLMGESEKNNQIITLEETPLSEVQQRYDDIRLGRGKFRNLNLEERVSLAEPLKSHITFLTTTKVARLKNDANNFVASMYSDPENIDTYFNQALDAANQLDSLNSFEAAKEVRLLADNMRTTIKVMDENAFATTSEIDEVLESKAQAMVDAAGTDEAAKAVSEFFLIREKFNEMAKARKDDPGGYTYSALFRKNGTVPTPQEMIQAQSQMGLSDSQLTPFRGQDLTNLKDELAGASAQDKLAIVRQFMSPYKTTTTLDDGRVVNIENIAMSRAISAGVVTPAMNIALHSASTTRAVDILNAEMIDDKKMRDTMEKPDIAKLSSSVNEALRPWFESTLGNYEGGILDQGATGQRINSIDGMRDAIFKLAMVYHTQGGQSLDESADNATDLIMGSYVFEEVGSQTLRMPNHLEGAMDTIIGVMEDRFTVDYLVDKVVIPESQFGAGNIPPASAALAYVEDIVKYGGWRTTNDDSGAFLVDANGNEVRLIEDFDGNIATAIDAETDEEIIVGSRFEVNFQDAFKFEQARDALQTELSEEAQVIDNRIEFFQELLRNETDRDERKNLYFQIKNLQDELVIVETWARNGTLPVHLFPDQDAEKFFVGFFDESRREDIAESFEEFQETRQQVGGPVR